MSIKIITVSRQFGSGGRTIAKELAAKLGYDYYDKEIIEQVAEKTGFSKDVVASKGEEAPGKSIFSYGFEAQATPGIMNGMTMNDYIWSVQRKVIKDIADSGKPCVIVGRSADFILKDYDSILNVYICADTKFRAERIVKLYGESDKKPEKRLEEKDKKRAANHKHFTDLEWGYAPNYDICLNSGVLGIDKCVEIIEDLVKKG
ncbi:MAG: cytidylate kinase-like family protein [Clostridiales bacterium]|jgi:cytidylate kinase|nr:cytidylate kinase-like family protein [Clostridiales bacterium]